MTDSKARSAARTIVSNPMEALDRLEIAVRSRWGRMMDRRPVIDSFSWIEMLETLDAEIGWDLRPYLAEHRLADAETTLKREVDRLPPHSSISINAGIGLARLSYAVCRLLSPGVVVETGVGYGVTTKFILEALQENAHGHLHSVDLPPLAERDRGTIGALVPYSIRDRWTLHVGSSRRVLPDVLTSVGHVDVFLHDSLHTRQAMAWEFARVADFLTHPSALISDDVEKNTAFNEWVAASRPAVSVIVAEEQRPSRFGLAAIT